MAETTPSVEQVISMAEAPSSVSSAQVNSSSTANSTCTFNDDVTGFISCEKQTVSTTTLIAVALGITVGILALLFLCVCLCRRNTRKRMEKAKEQARATPISSKQFQALMEEEAPPPLPTYRARGSASGSEEELLEQSKPPSDVPHQRRPILPSKLATENKPIYNDGSPTEPANARSLYPSNPSPNPRHLQPAIQRPRPARTGTDITTTSTPRRQSAYQRESTLIPPLPPPVHPPPPPVQSRQERAQPAPAMEPQAVEHLHTANDSRAETPQTVIQPSSIPTMGTTRPLSIRKSSAPSTYTNPAPPMPNTQSRQASTYTNQPKSQLKPWPDRSTTVSTAIPSYYEATRESKIHITEQENVIPKQRTTRHNTIRETSTRSVGSVKSKPKIDNDNRI